MNRFGGTRQRGGLSAGAGHSRRVWLDLITLSLRQRRTQIGAFLLSLVVLLALTGPFWAPYSPADLVGPQFAAPSTHSLLGTDYLGQDVLSRVLCGGRTVLWMSVAATALAVIIGVAIGLLAGYSRTWLLDELPMRLLDVILAVPGLVFVLLFVSILGPALWLIVLCVGVAFTPFLARISRGATLEVVGLEYVEWADANGIPRRRLLLREILPNIATPITVELGARLRYAIAIIAAVSFLGFGVQAPTADWGLMINENKLALYAQPWALLAPVICIAIFTLGSNLISEGIARTVAGLDRKGGAE